MFILQKKDKKSGLQPKLKAADKIYGDLLLTSYASRIFGTFPQSIWLSAVAMSVNGNSFKYFLSLFSAPFRPT